MQIPNASDSIFNQMHKHHFGVSTKHLKIDCFIARSDIFTAVLLKIPVL
jgi:hypothetical protein